MSLNIPWCPFSPKQFDTECRENLFKNATTLPTINNSYIIFYGRSVLGAGVSSGGYGSLSRVRCEKREEESASLHLSSLPSLLILSFIPLPFPPPPPFPPEFFYWISFFFPFPSPFPFFSLLISPSLLLCCFVF